MALGAIGRRPVAGGVAPAAKDPGVLPTSPPGARESLSGETAPSDAEWPRAGIVWAPEHSMLRIFPFFDTWRPSWQRKHPGQFRWPMCWRGYVFQFTLMAGNTLRS